MAIEIRELVIRAVVAPGRSQAPGPEGEDSGPDGSRAQLIEDCVAEVMKILRREKER
jgi:hypothetical protein